MLKTTVTDMTDASEINGARAVIIRFTLTDGSVRSVTQHPRNGLSYWGETPAQLLSNALAAMIGAGHSIDADKPFKWVIAS